MSAFIHRSPNLDQFAIRPGTAEWDRLWVAAKSQPWWSNSDEIGYVGCDETFWYFQKRGVTSGFARLGRAVTSEEIIEAALTAWDRQCLADIEAGIARIEQAIAQAPNKDNIRPLIGDARPMPLAYWQAEIETRRGWLADIKREYCEQQWAAHRGGCS